MSTAIAGLQYDPDSKTLRVIFVKGGVWTFENVESETAEAFKSAGSQGSFFNMMIRGKYSYRRGG